MKFPVYFTSLEAILSQLKANALLFQRLSFVLILHLNTLPEQSLLQLIQRGTLFQVTYDCIVYFVDMLFMTTKELLEAYYNGFAEKANWDSVIADDFQYVGGDMTKTDPVIGKQGYIEVINRFSRVFKSMRVKEMIIQRDSACVIGNYDFKFPNGKEINGNVADIWAVKNDKLQSLTIYFDTLTFANNFK